MAARGDDLAVLLWDPDSGKSTGTLPGPGLRNGDNACVAWSPDGARLATGTQHGGLLRVWDAATGQLLRALDGHDGEAVTSVSWEPGGARLASSGWDGTVRLWNPATGPLLDTI